jgi:hypothetical protein
VTRPSVNEEFQVGDRIRLLVNGDILLQGWGWMDSEDVPKATKGVEVELDKEWLQAQHCETEQRLLMLSKKLVS